MRALKRDLDVDENEFLWRYFEKNECYRRGVKETLRESLLDNIIIDVLGDMDLEIGTAKEAVRKAVDEGLATRNAVWFPDAKETLVRLRDKGYRLGLISNTHWRWLPASRIEMEGYFDVITLSYEHGLAKPCSSIFRVTLDKLRVGADRCLHVGDDPLADVHGARNAGMKTAFVRRGDKTADADIQIDRLGELIRIL